MSCKVGLVNYGIAGNIFSIQKALEKAGAEVIIILKKEDFQNIDKIVIPGVGTFNDAIDELKNSDLLETLVEQAKIKPTLGICLGMQILSRIGYEYGEKRGLSLINGEVKKIKCSGSVPHMGFNKIKVSSSNPLLKDIENEEFYFMHSYEFVNYTDVVALTEYCEHIFVSVVNKDNVYGIQFHPEKSRQAGIKLFKNFLEL